MKTAANRPSMPRTIESDEEDVPGSNVPKRKRVRPSSRPVVNDEEPPPDEEDGLANEERIICSAKKESAAIKKEIRMVYRAVQSGKKNWEKQLDTIVNELLHKNENQAIMLAKLNAEKRELLADRENLHRQLHRSNEIIVNKGLGLGRVHTRIMNIEKTTEENKESMASLRTDMVEMFNKVITAIDAAGSAQ